MPSQTVEFETALWGEKKCARFANIFLPANIFCCTTSPAEDKTPGWCPKVYQVFHVGSHQDFSFSSVSKTQTEWKNIQLHIRNQFWKRLFPAKFEKNHLKPFLASGKFWLARQHYLREKRGWCSKWNSTVESSPYS